MSGKKEGKLTGKVLVHKALLVATDLSSSERRVGAAMVDHMNSVSGRCDPGIRRLAFDTEYTIGTVQMAVSKLTDPSDPDRFFDNTNPGQGKTPCYKIRWHKVEAVVDQFEARTRLPTVQKLPNSSSDVTVLQLPNSDCSEGDRPTVRDVQNKTNLRTKGARLAAHQAAGPGRAPFESMAEKTNLGTGRGTLSPTSLVQPANPIATDPASIPEPERSQPTEASRARVSAAYQGFVRDRVIIDPNWPRGGRKRP